jgi:hypothetical protein
MHTGVPCPGIRLGIGLKLRPGLNQPVARDALRIWPPIMRRDDEVDPHSYEHFGA